MNKNCISLNISYLCSENNLTQNEFGELFNLGRSVISMYISGKSTPQLKTVIEICKHFQISLDDFILNDLSKLPITTSKFRMNNNEIDIEDKECKMCDMYERMLEGKDKLILALEREIESLRYPGKDSSQTA